MNLTIPDRRSFDYQMGRVEAYVLHGLDAGPVVVEIKRQTRTLEINNKFHAMIADIAKTVDLDQEYSFEAWKALLVDGFEEELRANSEKLRHGSKVVLSLDKKRAVTIRPSTTKFLKSEASQFIEYLYQFGAEHGARFTEKSLAIYDEISK